MPGIYIFTASLVIICILLMRRILIKENTIFELNDKLNLSDKEYVYLFNENLKLVEKIADLKLMNRIQNLNKDKNYVHES
jgi:hypothetical protein